MIKFKNVSFVNKEGNIILNNVSFEIKKNEYTTIVGKNGVGKSTVIKLMVGLLKINKGIIEIDGEKLEYSDEILYKIRKKIGIVFHSVEDQLTEETAIDNLIFGMENNNISTKKMRENVEKFSKYFKIENLLSRKISTLSGGEKQKIALVSAIVTEPKILILDEAMENIDYDFKKILNKFFDMFLMEGKTIISVSHDLEEIKRSDNILLLSENNNIKIGKFDDILHEYVNNKEYKNIENNKLIDLMNKSNKNGDNIKIKLDNVSYTYKENGKKIINNLSVCIPKGEIKAIIGKTGSGKTTLIELIYGLLDFDEYFDGDMIFYFGNKKIIINKNITLEKEIIKIREKMAIVFQNMESQFFESSVYKEIEYNISKKYNFIKNSFQVSNKIKKVLEKVGLSEKYMSKSPFLLSDGEKRLVGIAMALSTEPEILFLDEPTTSLDYEMIKKIMELIKELKKEKMTIILVTHDLNIVNNYADNYIKL